MITDADELRGLKILMAAGCIVSGIILALLVMDQRAHEHQQRTRQKCTDTVRATDGTQADFEMCFTPR